MCRLAALSLPLGLAPDLQWWGFAAGAMGLAAAGWLFWSTRRTERQYALDLAELEKAAAEARERAGTTARESQAKSELLATLSREVRSNLNGIIGSADLLLDDMVAPAPRQHLSTLRASAESLHRSLNDVLEYSTLETGQLRIARMPFELTEPMIEVVEQLSPLAHLKGLDVLLIIAPDAPRRVVGDAARLRQILLNLTANAVKFTAQGRVLLRVGLATDAGAVPRAGAVWLEFSVSDTGPGIPEELQATLFDRVGRLQAGAERQGGGSGLELAISKRLVELMGGTIGARNVPDGGSEFRVALPLEIEATPAPLPARKVDAGLHTVVLDPQAASRVAMSTLLARLGAAHDVADRLPEALALLRDPLEDEEVRGQALLIDEAIAAAHREELARLIREDDKLQQARVVLLARDAGAVAPLAEALGGVPVLRKPVVRAEVLLQALVRPTPDRTAPASVRERPLVLVVDDDEISRSVASQLLVRQGCAVETVNSGPEAVARAQAMPFDLIFMDCQMPVMDGFEATRKIRAALGPRAPLIVALTANTSQADRERAFASGMVDFVDKPVRRGELTRVLSRWVSVRS